MSPNGTPRILIVDDEPDIELLIRQRFKRRPGEFDFIFAHNGQEALDRLHGDENIDVVVTDINMPLMDGLTFLSKMNENGSPLKAVVLSAYGDMDNIRAAMNRGAFDFLTKPIDFADFEVTLRRTMAAIATLRQGQEAREQLIALQQELAIANRIQRSILPSLEDLKTRPEFDIYAHMEPARQVGGDLYDFFEIQGDRLGFVIGDVSGKGVPAALFMAVTETLLKATALQGLSPCDCLQYLNRVLGKQGDSAMYVTIFYGVLNLRTGEVQYCIGGHNPPFLVPANGSASLIEEPGGCVVGLLEDVTYETGTVQLQPGDSILLYTDGVSEAMNAEGRFFGDQRLRESLASHAGRSAKELTEGVLADVREYAQDNFGDDVTVLGLRWTPPLTVLQ